MASSLLLLLLLPAAATAVFSYGDYPSGGGGGGGFYFGGFENPWAFLFNFSGCHFGQSPEGLGQVKQYFANFGYLPSAPSFGDSFDDPFRAAVLAYQRFFHLNATGELDPATLAVMAQPRCGVADDPSSLPGRGLYSFFPGSPKWEGKTELTYAFLTGPTAGVDSAVLRTVFTRAFGRWAEVSTLRFSEVDPTSGQPDITVGFYSGDHGDGEPFDGQLGTLAHAFSPTDGRFHLDAAEMWVAAADDVAPENLLQSSAAVDLESVAVHEIGHLLGLGHSTVEGSIMYPTIKTRTRRVKLTQDDISAIQYLYGNNPNYNGTSNYHGDENTTATTTATTNTDGGGSVGVASGRKTSPLLRLISVVLLLLPLL